MRNLKLKRVKNRWAAVVSSVALVFVAGCAAPQPDGVKVVQQQQLPLQFVQPGDEGKLRELGLAERFISYWQAHIERDWKRRYAMETGLGSIQEKFYVAYHGGAWEIRAAEVGAVSMINDTSVVLKLRLRMADPDGGKRQMVLDVEDHWIRADGGWMHVAKDPMLTGIR